METKDIYRIVWCDAVGNRWLCECKFHTLEGAEFTMGKFQTRYPELKFSLAKQDDPTAVLMLTKIEPQPTSKKDE